MIMGIENIRENSTCEYCGRTNLKTTSSDHFSTGTESFSVTGGKIFQKMHILIFSKIYFMI